VFEQQSLQPKLSRRRYASVSYALQNNTVFRCAQNWVSVSDEWRTDNGTIWCWHKLHNTINFGSRGQKSRSTMFTLFDLRNQLRCIII